MHLHQFKLQRDKKIQMGSKIKIITRTHIRKLLQLFLEEFVIFFFLTVFLCVSQKLYLI